MQPQRADVPPFFGFLAALEHLLATWQASMQAARTAVRARQQNPGIVLRAIGSTRLLNAPAPLRTGGLLKRRIVVTRSPTCRRPKKKPAGKPMRVRSTHPKRPWSSNSATDTGLGDRPLRHSNYTIPLPFHR